MTTFPENDALARWKSRLFLALIILFVVFVRVRLSSFPLERDEGEYAYMGQLMLQGISPYVSAYNMKFPGTYAMYALIMSVFGQTIQGIHIGLTIVNCAAVLLVFLLAKKLVSDGAALPAAAAYALLSLSPTVLGFAGHATHFVVLPALGGVLALLHALRNNKVQAFFWSGALLGLSVLMKQPGLFFFLFGATYILYHHWAVSKSASSPPTLPTGQAGSLLKGEGPNNAPSPSRVAGSNLPLSLPPVREDDSNISPPLRGGDKGEGDVAGLTHGRDNSTTGIAFRFGAFSLGGALPLLITIISLYAAGAFDRFWFWTFEYASKYGSQVPLSGAFAVFKENMAGVAEGHLFFWIMSVAGLVCTFSYHGLKGRRIFIVLFTFFSFLTICPGFYFRSHYFITLLPAVSLLTGIFTDWVNDRSGSLLKTRYAKFIGVAVFILAAGMAIASEKDYLFEEDPSKLSRAIYGENPFPESLEIAGFIKANSSVDDRVAVFGSEPQIYFYSGRRSATGYIYTYGLMEIHPYALEMQKEMIREVMSSEPKFIIVVNVYTSWLMRPDSERYIFGWLGNYIQTNYAVTGIADIISSDNTVYRWNDDAKTYAVRGEAHVVVLERK